jgi:hypothetical protein
MWSFFPRRRRLWRDPSVFIGANVEAASIPVIPITARQFL